MNPEILLQTLAVAERLKCNTRHCYTSSGRHESVAEHSWRISLMAMLVADEFPEADMNKVIRMCLIHDLGEAFTGDIPTFWKTGADEATEENLLNAWVNTLPEPQKTDFADLYAEMNALETLEAKIYKALDKLEAIIQHNAAAPIGHINQQNVLVGGFQHQQTIAGVLRLDGGFTGDAATQSFAEQVADTLNAGSGIDTANSPLHCTGLQGDVCGADLTYNLALTNIHFVAVVCQRSGAGRNAQITLILHNLEGTHFADDLNIIIIKEILYTVHSNTSFLKIEYAPVIIHDYRSFVYGFL